MWGQDLAKEAHDRDKTTGYRFSDIFGRAFENSKKGITTILDLGSTDKHVLRKFADSLNQAKEADASFNPPTLNMLFICLWINCLSVC